MYRNQEFAGITGVDGIEWNMRGMRNGPERRKKGVRRRDEGMEEELDAGDEK